MYKQTLASFTLRMMVITWLLSLAGGCSSPLAYGPGLWLPGTDRALMVSRPSATRASVVCLTRNTDAYAKSGSLLLLMDDLCRGYQSGELTSDQYRNSLAAVAPLTVIAKAGAYLRAHDLSPTRQYYRDLLGVMQQSPQLTETCRLLLSKKPDLVLLTLCHDALETG
jgi:hypothetical protein